jgi:hypothetical protein
MQTACPAEDKTIAKPTPKAGKEGGPHIVLRKRQANPKALQHMAHCIAHHLARPDKSFSQLLGRQNGPRTFNTGVGQRSVPNRRPVWILLTNLLGFVSPSFLLHLYRVAQPFRRSQIQRSLSGRRRGCHQLTRQDWKYRTRREQ